MFSKKPIPEKNIKKYKNKKENTLLVKRLINFRHNNFFSFYLRK